MHKSDRGRGWAEQDIANDVSAPSYAERFYVKLVLNRRRLVRRLDSATRP
ncbi:MAG: hypothetical protein AVDCRST_MAG42-3065 [uncultured Chthoniobacterales bacterium]|uniref:Uncharacterized protein n=1 Tax=uncultured Chthoniobacterales bacterium TaxID=1836801 RepID=A0A6J4J3P6_9BACT|nr:MAG: hypothetical protein AVDCRST_MAG42-3065 [uncultured Chthoniobacterales bacterium]